MDREMPQARIIGTGSYLPKQILTNRDLETIVETSDEWIVTRTGIRERRIASKDEYPSDMGALAAQQALLAAGIDAAALDLIVVATMTPDYITPSTAALIQEKLGASQAAAFDLQAACTGYLYGLSMAKAYIESGMYKTVLVVATEKMSAFIDYTDRSTCVLFGDGAAAAVISGGPSPGLVIEHICLGADGSLGDLFIAPAGGARHPATAETVAAKMHTFKMKGPEVFKHAVRRMMNATQECLEAVGLSERDIRWLVPHQANIRIIETLAKGFKIDPERVYITLQKYGNTSASALPIALDELIREKGCADGEHLLLVAFGAGLTWGAALLTQHL